MKIDSSEIASLIKAQIKGYEQEIKEDDVGTVISVGDGIALVYGLNNAMLGELLIFPHDVYGMVMNLDAEDVGCVLLGSDYEILEGDTVKRTHKVVEVPVGDGLLGRVVNALGQPIDEMGAVPSKKTRPVERIAPGVMTRKSVDTPLETGIKAIDAMIPIGRGQRELIIGDRQTGKTAIALDAIINQKGKNVKCVYVAIGQKNSSVASLVEKLKEKQCMDYVTVVSSSASESAPLQYLAPFAGMAMAEEWMENGEDVLNGIRIIENMMPKKIDMLKYLAMLSQYTIVKNHDIGRVMVGYSAYSSRESYYADYVSYILHLEQESRKDKFNGFDIEQTFPNHEWKERFKEVKAFLERNKKNLGLESKNNAFTSWIDTDYWLYGLLYYMLFKGKHITREQELVEEIRKEIENKRKVREDGVPTEYQRNPNRIGNLRNRIAKSLEIYKRYAE
ncbi:MAG: hypothetical protein J6328_00830 [Bacilli bacterium]|nr:hypothetical protein [Bacilli bacterium]